MIRSAVNKIRQLDAQRAKLIAAAKSEALKKVAKALQELNDLGFNYKLVTDGDRQLAFKKAKKGRGKGRVTKGACKICGFSTIPPHDARTHRGQSKKAPLTNEELVGRGMRRR